MYNNTNGEALIAVAQNRNTANVSNTTPKQDKYDIYWDRNGKEIYRKVNNQPKDRTFIVKTTRIFDDVYKDYLDAVNSRFKTEAERKQQIADDKVNGVYPPSVLNIPIEAAKKVEKAIKNGTLSGTVKYSITVTNSTTNIPVTTNHTIKIEDSIVEIENIEMFLDMYLIAINDDGKGGTKPTNNQEYGGLISFDDVITQVIGHVASPKTQLAAEIQYPVLSTTRSIFHTHPSGDIEEIVGYEDKIMTKTTYKQKYHFHYPPSYIDTYNFSGDYPNYVFSRGSEKSVYVYNGKGVLAIFPSNRISSYQNDVQKDEMKELEEDQKAEKKKQEEQHKKEKSGDSSEATKQRHKKEKDAMNEKQKNEKDAMKQKHENESKPTVITATPPTP